MINKKVAAFFEKKYNNTPITVKAPGRINLIGEHTDYNNGFVLPAAIEKGIYFAVGPSKNKSLRIEAFLSQPEIIEFDFNGNNEPFQFFWGNYFKAIIEILITKNYPFRGMNCVFGGDIPIGSGLSSSAALCCGFIYAITKVSKHSISKEEIALIAQKAEHKIGLNCGLMDQYAVLFGKKGNAFFLDCNDLTHKYIPINLKGYSWILINSKIKHNLAVDSEYNKRRISCENIVSEVKKYNSSVQSLRDITTNDLEKIVDKSNPIDLKRAKYIIEENNRVSKMIAALSLGDASLVGTILKAGHWAMSNQYEITTSELDFLVSTGEKLEGILGSRMMGGGFGGCTINLMKDELVKESLAKLLLYYKKETGIDAEYYHLNIDDGVKLV